MPSSFAQSATGDLVGICSPAFRWLDAGPLVMLTARGANPTMYRTTFLRVSADESAG